MTGSNRLLIGVGWPLVAFVAFAAWKRRSAGDAPQPGAEDAPQPGADDASVTKNEIRLPAVRRVDVAFLAVASAYAFVIPLTRRLAWYDTVVLLGLFALYLWRVSREEQQEPELIGVSATLGALPRNRRRVVVPLLFLAVAAIVLLSAEPFANGLVGTGKRLGIDEFLLVQWLAPLASEAPELIVASLFVWRLRGGDALGTLLSSKVNQWTLLVGSIPLAYLAGGGGAGGLHLDGRQTEEFLLTSAQALLGLMVLVDLRFSRRDANAPPRAVPPAVPVPRDGCAARVSPRCTWSPPCGSVCGTGARSSPRSAPWPVDRRFMPDQVIRRRVRCHRPRAGRRLSRVVPRRGAACGRRGPGSQSGRRIGGSDVRGAHQRRRAHGRVVPARSAPGPRARPVDVSDETPSGAQGFSSCSAEGSGPMPDAPMPCCPRCRRCRYATCVCAAADTSQRCTSRPPATTIRTFG